MHEKVCLPAAKRVESCIVYTCSLQIRAALFIQFLGHQLSEQIRHGRPLNSSEIITNLKYITWRGKEQVSTGSFVHCILLQFLVAAKPTTLRETNLFLIIESSKEGKRAKTSMVIPFSRNSIRSKPCFPDDSNLARYCRHLQ